LPKKSIVEQMSGDVKYMCERKLKEKFAVNFTFATILVILKCDKRQVHTHFT